MKMNSNENNQKHSIRMPKKKSLIKFTELDRSSENRFECFDDQNDSN